MRKPAPPPELDQADAYRARLVRYLRLLLDLERVEREAAAGIKMLADRRAQAAAGVAARRILMDWKPSKEWLEKHSS